MGEFPWATASVIGDVGADIWWGFHLFLMPVSWMAPGLIQIQIAGVLVLSTALMILYWAARELKLPNPWLWPLLIVGASAGVNWRMTMIRPQVLSLALLALLIAFLINRNPRAVFGSAFAFAFIHQTASWIVLPLVVAFCVLLRISDVPFRGKELGFAALGLIAPWIARPNPVGALEVMKVQILDLSRARAERIPLNFGTELGPYPLWSFLTGLGLFLGFSVMILGLWKMNNSEERSNAGVVFALSGLSVALLVATVWITRRALDPAMAILVVTLGVSSIGLGARELQILTGVGLSLCAITGITSQALLEKHGVNPMRLVGVTQALKREVPPGDVVTHTWWPMFADLMYWDPSHRYIGGMDPIFQYSHSPEKWFALRNLSRDTDPGNTLTILFRSRTLVLVKAQSPEFVRRLRDLPGVRAIFEDESFAVFQFPARNLTQSSRN